MTNPAPNPDQPHHGPIDEVDPHGFHAVGPHGHRIVRTSTLVAVLLVLLVFTGLTVAASRAEVWAATAFGIEIPQLVNVAVALSIAVVKSVLVAMFFMQLKYDNPLNSLVFLFCLFAFALFMFFAMTDLGTRGMVYPYKAMEVRVGGTGGGVERRTVDAEGKPAQEQITAPIVEFVKDKRVKEVGADKFAEEAAEAAHQVHGEPVFVDRTLAHARSGLTPGLFDPRPAQAPEGHH